MEEKILNQILSLAVQSDRPLLIAIDGRCASGKTTLAQKIAPKLQANVIHADHFFLQPHQRTEKRLATPGQNIDWERLLDEVILPIRQGKTAIYRPFDCKKQDFGEEIVLPPCKINIVEGSYSCHPKLWEQYDLHFFLSVDPKTQLERIRKRNGEAALPVFKEKWIVLEERYFAAFDIPSRCICLN